MTRPMTMGHGRRGLSAVLMLLVAPLLLLPLLVGACVSNKKPKKEPTAALEKYILAEPPADLQKLDIDFDGKITLLGYKLNKKGPVKVGEKISYTLYWKVNKELGQSGWKLYTHVLDETNKRLLNIDGVGPLRDYQKNKDQTLPPSAWKAGKVYVDEQSFAVPKSAAGKKIKIVTGIWKGEERLKVAKGPSAGENRALVATLTVGGKAKDAPKVPELRVDRLAAGQKIKIDGKLDEEAWKTAATTGPFVHVGTGKPDPKSPVSGSAKFLWDKEYLYAAFDVKDADIVGGFAKDAKDPHLWTKDTIELMIDPDGDGDNKDYYEIQVGPQNLVFDSRFDSYNQPKGGKDGPFGNQDWSAKLESAVVVDGTLDKAGDTDKGYLVELRIPWKSFDKAKRVPPELGESWRMNFYAMQDNGGVAWSPILGQGNFHKASRFGRVLWAEAGWVPPAAPAGSLRVNAEAIREAAARLEGAASAPSSAAPDPTAPTLGPAPPKTPTVVPKKPLPAATTAP